MNRSTSSSPETGNLHRLPSMRPRVLMLHIQISMSLLAVPFLTCHMRKLHDEKKPFLLFPHIQPPYSYYKIFLI